MGMLLAEASSYHPHSPPKRYLTLVAQWSSEAGECESKKMSAIQLIQRKGKSKVPVRDSLAEEEIIADVGIDCRGAKEEVRHLVD